MQRVRWRSKLRPLASAQAVGNGQGAAQSGQGSLAAGVREPIRISRVSATRRGRSQAGKSWHGHMTISVYLEAAVGGGAGCGVGRGDGRRSTVCGGWPWAGKGVV